MAYNCRLLNLSEWDRVSEIFLSEFDCAPPSPLRTMIIVVEHGDRIVGMLPLQQVIHAEPMWIDPEYRGKFSFTKMVNKAYDTVPTGEIVFAMAPSQHVERMLEIAGLVKVPDSVWRWRKPYE